MHFGLTPVVPVHQLSTSISLVVMPRKKPHLEYSSTSPFIGPQEQALFLIEDTRQKADQLQAVLVPKLELILDTAQDQIRDIYGKDALPQSLFRIFKSPAHRKQAKTTANFQEASVGLCLKPVKNWFFQLQIKCNYSDISVVMFGLRGREGNPFVRVMQSYSQEISEMLNLGNIYVESRAIDLDGLLPDQDLDIDSFISRLQMVGEKEWKETAFYAEPLSLPILEHKGASLIIDNLVTLYPIFSAASSNFIGESDHFTADFGAFLNWHEQKDSISLHKPRNEQDLHNQVIHAVDTVPAVTPETVLNLFPEEVGEEKVYQEGTLKQVKVNSYERDPKARQKCIDFYGTDCLVCGFNFGQAFGKIGQGFIHVHHLRPLSEIGQEYTVDPVQDLRPVCPNCHAMLHHSKDRTLSIEELQTIVKQHQS